MALLTPQQISLVGTSPAYGSAAAGGDTVAPDDRAFLHIKNTNGATRDVTIVTPGTTFGQANADVVKTVPATTGDVMMGPLVPALADPTTGLISITWSAVTGITVAVVKV